jgi:hypothetical protein
MSRPYLKAINLNKLEDRIDKSAWARLNDILWEPNRIPRTRIAAVLLPLRLKNKSLS